MKFLDIGAVAAASGVKPSALRHYEAVGLIRSVGRRGLRRQFPPEVLLQLQLIALAKTAGFALDEIAGLFGRDGLPDLPRATFRAKADALDRQIRDLTLLRDTLTHIADCPAPSHLECPSFQRLLGRPGHPGRRDTARSQPT